MNGHIETTVALIVIPLAETWRRAWSEGAKLIKRLRPGVSAGVAGASVGMRTGETDHA